MSDLDILLDNRKFVKRALATMDIEELKLLNQMERVALFKDIHDSRNKVLNYLGYERNKEEQGIWIITKNTLPEEKEIEYFEKWLDEYYKDYGE